MGPALFPTYKKVEGRPHANYKDPSWPESVYRILFKEVFYKGGFTVDRVPGWCDRVVFHSLPHLRGNMYPLSRGAAARTALQGRAADTAMRRGTAGRGPASSGAGEAEEGPIGGRSGSRGSIGDVAGGITATTASLAKASASGIPWEAPADVLATASSYDAINDFLTVSDHSPVSCVFRVLCAPSPMGGLPLSVLEARDSGPDGQEAVHAGEGGGVHEDEGDDGGGATSGPLLVTLPVEQA